MNMYMTVEFDTNLEMTEYLNKLDNSVDVKSVWSTPRKIYCLLEVKEK